MNIGGDGHTYNELAENIRLREVCYLIQYFEMFFSIVCISS